MCIIWGTTYLGIRIALDSFTPALLVAVRFLISGSIIVGGALVMKARLPKGRELWLTALHGAIILGLGSGALTLTETWLPTGLAALFITTSPFWLVGSEALFPGGERLHLPAIAGLAVGLGGSVLLVSQSALRSESAKAVLTGFFIIQLGCAGWGVGSILHRRLQATVHSIVSGGIQQLGAGAAFTVVAILTRGTHFRWTPQGVGALFYLVIAGSIIGYSSYTYVLVRLPVPLVSIYTYVNPVIAVSLGWLVFREAFSVREGLAMCVIFAGVAIVKRYGHTWKPGPEDARDPAAA